MQQRCRRRRRRTFGWNRRVSQLAYRARWIFPAAAWIIADPVMRRHTRQLRAGRNRRWRRISGGARSPVDSTLAGARDDAAVRTMPTVPYPWWEDSSTDLYERLGTWLPSRSRSRAPRSRLAQAPPPRPQRRAAAPAQRAATRTLRNGSLVAIVSTGSAATPHGPAAKTMAARRTRRPRSQRNEPDWLRWYEGTGIRAWRKRR